MINQKHEDDDKIQYLLYHLPRKARGWFDKFLECLHNSSACTGHEDIAKSLSDKLEGIEVGIQNDGHTASVSTPIPVSSDCEDDKEVHIL